MRLTGKPAQVGIALQAMADSHIKRGDYQQDGIKSLFGRQETPPVTGQGSRSEPTYPAGRAGRVSRQSRRLGALNNR